MAANEADDDARLCANCVGESFLSAEMQRQGAVAPCSFCGKEGKTYSLEKLADRVEAALEQHYSQTPSEPSDYEYALIKEGEYEWDRDGSPILDVIQAAGDVAEEPAREILSVLQGREGYTEGEEGKFDDEAHYIDATASDWGIHSEWLKFEKSLKTEARFFSSVAQQILAHVFADLHAQQTKDGKGVVTQAGPGKTISVLFRARTFQSDSRLEEALRRPDLQIGSPPPELATAGRMNAHGISVFYGAMDPGVAVAEVRPPVGSRVVVGQFLVIRPLRLLDVEALRSVLVTGSVFDPLFIGRRERARFLERLSRRISMPVMPSDEAFDYLVTQVIAEYLASTGLDGLIFPSVQVSGGKNVVLFHKAARVEQLEIPKGANVSAHLDQMTEDGPEVDYSVIEWLPRSPPADGDLDVLHGPPSALAERDPRETTLRLDVGKLEVRHITGVTFETEKYAVRRNRYKPSDKF